MAGKAGSAAEFRRVVRAALQARLNAPELSASAKRYPGKESYQRKQAESRDRSGEGKTATTHIPKAGYVEKRPPAAKFRTATRARSIMFAGSWHSGNQPKSL